MPTIDLMTFTFPVVLIIIFICILNFSTTFTGYVRTRSQKGIKEETEKFVCLALRASFLSIALINLEELQERNGSCLGSYKKWCPLSFASRHNVFSHFQRVVDFSEKKRYGKQLHTFEDICHANTFH